MALLMQLTALAEEYPSAVNAGLEILLKRAQENAPVRTGELRDSGHIDGDAVVFSAGHARFVEFGTSRMAARPFLRRAIDENQNEILQAMADEVNAEMARRT